MDSLLFLGALVGIAMVVIWSVVNDDRKANAASQELLQKLSARGANAPDTTGSERPMAHP